jgi:hypothetical protein
MPSVADRFELQQELLSGSGGTYFHGLDSTLGRDVGVLLLDPGHPRTEAVLAAARAASSLPEEGFLRVLDAAKDDGRAYVVTQWARGTDLEDLLASGPLDVDDAVSLCQAVATALAVAHSVGLAHLHLGPRSVLRTEDGGVRIVGVAVDSAMRGTALSDPAAADRVDTRAVGSLLYRLLTGQQVSAQFGVSAARRRPNLDPAVDAVVMRSLGADIGPGRPPLDTCADLAEALADLAPAQEPTSNVLTQEPRPPVGPRLSAGVLAAIAVVAVGLIGWLLLTWGWPQAQTSPDPEPAPTSADSAESPTADPDGESLAGSPIAGGGVIAIVSAEDLDPEGNGAENPGQAALAIDGDLTTSWRTVSYRGEDFGGLKSGVGLLLDLGGVQQVASVSLDIGIGPTDVELRASEQRGATADAYTTVATAESAAGTTDLVPQRPAEARYLLVWLTRLPVEAADRNRGAINEIFATRA